jgi:ABC-type branched-subunit amino acid transport system ATPase component
MKIHLEKLGHLDRVDLEVGDLTIVCGENNSGKTYATYALYGFLRMWAQGVMHPHPLAMELAQSLPQTGVAKLDLLTGLLPTAESYFEGLSKEYTGQLARVFASKDVYFQESVFQFRPTKMDPLFDQEFAYSVKTGAQTALTFSKAAGSSVLEIASASDMQEPLPSYATANFIDDIFRRLLWSQLVPVVHISSAERTGATIFSKSLNFTRDKLFNTMHRLETDKTRPPQEDLFSLLFHEYEPDYALAVRDNVQFMDTLEKISKQTSPLIKACPELETAFGKLIGGSYKAGKDGLFYIPKGSRAKLTMSESSSAVRSLLDVGFLIKHVLAPGDLFIIDEPELNLHPSNQRKLARILARMVNHGVRVFLTTHSDYIIREFNTLIVGSGHMEEINRRLKKKGDYEAGEFLDAGKVRLYIACSEKENSKGKGPKPTVNVIKEQEIDPITGMMVLSFDDEIGAMNEIQDLLIELNEEAFQ